VGASILGRNDTGSIKPGMASDLVAFRVDGLEQAGAQSDPVGALLTCSATRVWLSIINGRIVVENGQLIGVDLPALVAHHNAISRNLMQA